MGLNVIVMIAGMIVVLVSLFLFLKKQPEEQETMDLMPIKAQDNQQVLEQLAILREELGLLRDQVAGFSVDLEELKELNQQEELVPAIPASEEHLEQQLNYTRFSQKNNKVIQLHQDGKSMEEIARVLGKSVREVEMVIKLTK